MELGHTRNFTYCLKLANIEQYPSYLFFAKIGSINPNLPHSPYVLFQANQCLSVSGYRPITTIVAIAKSEVNPNDLEFSTAGTVLSDTKTQALGKTFIEADPTIESPFDLPLFYFGQQIEDTYHVQSITSTDLRIAFVNRSPHLLYWIIFSIVGMIIVGWMLWQRRRSSKVSKS
jgi:hypothetical protein